MVLLTNVVVDNHRVLDLIASIGTTPVAFKMFFFAGFAFLAALAFGSRARRYRMLDHYRSG